MKRVILILSLIFLFNFVYADEYENSTLQVSVDLVEPFAMIDISPSSVYLGQVTKGYQSEYENITATNIGNIDVKIKPMLPENAPEIFNFLKFSSSSCSSWSGLETWTSSVIDKSDIYGEQGEEYNFCIKLDLKSYDEEISSNVQNVSTEVIFWVMPA